MLKKIILKSCFLLCCVSFIYAAPNDSLPEVSTSNNLPNPTIGLGIGMLKYYGDINDAQYGNPLISRIGYDLHVKQPLNDFLTFKFYVLFGKLSANERSIERNLNFESKITAGGFAAIYNFDHILPKDRILNPFVSVGIESIEFNSKTDLYDQNGNKYHYWSDGSIRDIDENAPNASQSVVIQRDYTYETDMRELNEDGFGKYPERAFAVPIGVGAKMHMSKHLEFTISSTLHFTFTDYLDNVSDESTGERIGLREGSKRNDRFLMTSVALSYTFQKHKKHTEIKNTRDKEYIDYAMYDNEDEDNDGVIDFIDECPWTPEGVEVDEKGCPLDMDKDFVPNYKDDELESRPNVPVTRQGVELTDEMIYQRYLAFMDSTGIFADVESRLVAGEKSKKKSYKVQIGSFTTGVDPEMVDRFLSIPDVNLTTFGDSLTVFTVGNYNNLPEAIKRKIELTEQGVDGALIVSQKGKDGPIEYVGDEANNMTVDNELVNELTSKETLFRIQLGAFSKKQPFSIFNGLKNVLEIKGNDGLYKYVYNKSFNSMEEAATSKVDLLVEYGLTDAYIVAYNSGERISLKEAGVNTTAEEKDFIQPTNTSTNNKEVKLKIQLGIYKNQLPIEVLSKFMELESIDQVTLSNGLTRYTSGEFTNFNEAEAFKNELIEKGFGGAFIIALKGEQLISLDDAKQSLEE